MRQELVVEGVAARPLLVRREIEYDLLRGVGSLEARGSRVDGGLRLQPGVDARALFKRQRLLPEQPQDLKMLAEQLSGIVVSLKKCADDSEEQKARMARIEQQMSEQQQQIRAQNYAHRCQSKNNDEHHYIEK